MLLSFPLVLAIFGFGGNPSITTAALPSATVGVAYKTTYSATGGRLPYRWSTTSNLPAGLSLSQSGVLSGTPKAAGTFSLTVRVTDARNRAATKALPLVVAAGAPPPLVIQTVTIPNGTVGKPYSFQIQVTGGRPPYTCTPDQNNNLAEFGLVLDTSCLLHGTALKAGTVHF